MNYDTIVVLGPTASGKTRLGAGIAREVGGEIISADSRQVYRGMDIGTGKDLEEYGEVPYHLIDILNPGEEFNVFRFQRLCFAAMDEVRGRGRVPVIVGGTGLYLDAVLRGYRMVEAPEDPVLRAELALLSPEELTSRLLSLNPRLHNTTDLLDRGRLVRAIEIAAYERDHDPEPLPEIHPMVFGVRWERSALRRRITARLTARLDAGLIQEVERLHREGVPYETLEFYGLEYRFVSRHLTGELNRNDLFQKLNSAIHDFAKRQETWFRRMERQGVAIHWLDGSGAPLEEALALLRHQGTAEREKELS
ncbi:MAG: tRNA (adenosine(37)-N6)-dimethylallyltransferase MiaA [Geobacteraceae bacterium]|nr:tRNA (adenosine(37)-N6)-dimethylallyltransferase MiaA [Geobacteraceae bacterium]